jgi:hypothetical protein
MEPMITEMRDDMKSLLKLMNGNGTPGYFERVRVVESDIREMKAGKKEERRRPIRAREWIAFAISGLCGIAGVISWIVGAMHGKV